MSDIGKIENVMTPMVNLSIEAARASVVISQLSFRLNSALAELAEDDRPEKAAAIIAELEKASDAARQLAVYSVEQEVLNKGALSDLL